MKTKHILISLGVTVLVLLILLFMSVFTIQEGQLGLVLRLGELQKTKTGQIKIYQPGLHFKIPLITTVRKLDVRLQNLSEESSRILTKEQKYVIVDYFAKWKIANLPLYYKRTGGNANRAQMLLQQKINDVLRGEIGSHTIKEVVSGERMNIMKLLQNKANQSAQVLGIDVNDVRIIAIDLPQQVRDSVYQRMRSEREQVAAKHRSQGQAQAESIRANADATVAVLLAKARASAQQIRANGDAAAAKIYTKSYSKNPKFYALYRSLEAYRQVFHNQGTVMVLRPNSEFFKYFMQKKAGMGNKAK